MGSACGSHRSVNITRDDSPSFKVVLVGDAEVGKTAIFMRYTRNQFDFSYQPTVAVCIGNVVKKVNVPTDAVVSVAVWDLPGREEVDLRRSYYKDIDAAIGRLNTRKQIRFFWKKLSQSSKHSFLFSGCRCQ
jgi:protein lin-28